jgi:hypothetical protein
MDILQKFKVKAQARQRELDEQQSRLDAEAQRASQLQRDCETLQLGVDRAADRLQMADAQFASFKARESQLKETLVNLWGGGPQGYNGITPSIDYGGLLAVTKAIESYSEVRLVLTKDLQDAQHALEQFTRQHGF